MPSFEAMPQPRKEGGKEKSGKFEKMGRNLMVAAALAGPMGATSLDVEASTVEGATAERMVPGKEIRKQEIERQLESARKFMFEKLDDLDIFSGPGFVEDVKKNSTAIRNFLEHPEVVPRCPGVLGDILKRYAKPLALAQRVSPELYLKTTTQFKEALEVIETESLLDMKDRLASIF